MSIYPVNFLQDCSAGEAQPCRDVSFHLFLGLAQRPLYAREQLVSLLTSYFWLVCLTQEKNSSFAQKYFTVN